MHKVGSGQRAACGLYFIVNKFVLFLLPVIKLSLLCMSVLYYTFQSLESFESKFPKGEIVLIVWNVYSTVAQEMIEDP